jgi:predicted RNA binding protein YcfA (HicA-like mRNA interferase family)
MSAIDYRKLRSLTARQLISALEREGFQLRRHRGPHYRYVHVDGRRVTIAFHHLGQTFKMGTLRSIIEKQARWTEADLKRLKLIKS